MKKLTCLAATHIAAVLTLAAMGCGGTQFGQCNTSSDCESGSVCKDGLCYTVPTPALVAEDGGTVVFTEDGGTVIPASDGGSVVIADGGEVVPAEDGGALLEDGGAIADGGEAPAEDGGTVVPASDGGITEDGGAVADGGEEIPPADGGPINDGGLIADGGQSTVADGGVAVCPWGCPAGQSCTSDGVCTISSCHITCEAPFEGNIHLNGCWGSSVDPTTSEMDGCSNHGSWWDVCPPVNGREISCDLPIWVGEQAAFQAIAVRGAEVAYGCDASTIRCEVSCGGIRQAIESPANNNGTNCFVAVSANPPPPLDGGQSELDAGVPPMDAGVPANDGGAISDGGAQPADGGAVADGGNAPDGGAIHDGGEAAEDGGPIADGGALPDGGAVADGGNAPDGGSFADGGSSEDGGPIADGGNATDGGALPDGGVIEDGGPIADGGNAVDGGALPDGGATEDGGAVADGGLPVDGGMTVDGGVSNTPVLMGAVMDTWTPPALDNGLPRTGVLYVTACGSSTPLCTNGTATSPAGSIGCFIPLANIHCFNMAVDVNPSSSPSTLDYGGGDRWHCNSWGGSRFDGTVLAWRWWWQVSDGSIATDAPAPTCKNQAGGGNNDFVTLPTTP